MESISEGWGLYFPEVPEAEKDNFNYPVPFSQRFWRLYGEPLED
jgi:hypothetical protein